MKRPYLKLIQKSQEKEEALIFLNGYQMKYTKNSEMWSNYLRQANWQGSIYQLWWDGGSEHGRKYAMSPLGNIPILNELVHSYPHWRMILKRAKISGLKYLPSLLSNMSENKISLIRYSLGCRVIHYGMQQFQPSLNTTSINNIFLLAGAIRTIRWENIANKITGKIYNFYNDNDELLNDLFSHFGIYKYKPCGIHPILSEHKDIKNINVTKSIHSNLHDLELYLRILHKFD